jgi:hypothetical protein
MTVGFIGAKVGMTWKQAYSVRMRLTVLKAQGFTISRTGLSTMSDQRFHGLATELGIRIIGHPGVRRDGTCVSIGNLVCDEVLPAKYLLDRDYDIVIGSDVMIATPGQFDEQRSGSATWTVVRYTRQQKKSLYLIYPDGTVNKERIK